MKFYEIYEIRLERYFYSCTIRGGNPIENEPALYPSYSQAAENSFYLFLYIALLVEHQKIFQMSSICE